MPIVTIPVEVVLKARLPSLIQRAIQKLERGGIRVVTLESTRNRVTVHGEIRVKL